MNTYGSSYFLGDWLVDGLVGAFRLTSKGLGFPTLLLTATCPETFYHPRWDDDDLYSCMM